MASPERITVVHDSSLGLSNPFKLFGVIGQDLLRGRELAFALFARDIRAQYRLSYLGYFWAIVPAVVASLTFIFLRSQGIVKVESPGIPYPAFALTGTLLWQVFVDSLNGPATAVHSSRAMLTKIYFPRESLIIASCLTVLFNCLIRLVVLVCILIYWQITPNLGLLFFIPSILAIIGFGMGIGLILSPVSGLYGDVSRALTMASSFLVLLTPVLYPPPESGALGIMTRWNPLSPLIVTARESLTGSAFSQLPAFAMVSVASVALTCLGIVIYRLTMPHVIVRMGG